MQRKLFWKLALTFLALLLSVLLAVDFLAERALRRSYENDSYRELRAVARALVSHPLNVSSLPPQTPEEIAALNSWVSSAALTGVRVTVISGDGKVAADSESEVRTMESHADRPEVREALEKGEGRSTRQSVTLKKPFLYYAVRQSIAGNVPVVIRLALPVEGIGESLGTFRESLWIWSVLIFLIAGAVALAMSRSYTDRIERLR